MKEILKDAIKTHYDNKDYTEVVRDALLCLNTEIRRKSDLQDLDGVNLINTAFSEKNPLIKINKLQTETERNKQYGIRDLSKGLIEYFRNPMSHEKQKYSKSVAEALLTLIDEVILEEIIDSKSINSLEDWYNEIKNELSPNSQRYAENLIQSIPKDKHYDLIVMLYRSRNEFQKEKNSIINELLNKLSVEDFKEFCKLVESDLFGEIKEENLQSILKFITPTIWNEFSDLAKTKIEDIIYEDIKDFLYEYDYDNYGNYMGIIQNNGHLLKSSSHLLKEFSNKNDIANIIIDKILEDTDNHDKFDYLMENYFEFIINTLAQKRYDFIDAIYDRLRYKDRPIWKNHMPELLKKVDSFNPWYVALAEKFNLPLVDPFTDEKLPFKKN